MADDPKPVFAGTEFQILQLMRADAINSYAQFEQALCRLFGRLLRTPLELGAVVFYRITNTHSRNNIIQELLTARHGTRFEAYWNGIPNTPNKSGMFTLIRQLDQSRNEIVHWHMVARFLRGSSTPTEIGLMKPDIWPISFDADKRAISAVELMDFSRKAGFVTRSLGLFDLKLQGSLEPPHEAHATWQEIFSQPASYPPADTHPLFLKQQVPENPPLPSGA